MNGKPCRRHPVILGAFVACPKGQATHMMRGVRCADAPHPCLVCGAAPIGSPWDGTVCRAGHPMEVQRTLDATTELLVCGLAPVGASV